MTGRWLLAAAMAVAGCDGPAVAAPVSYQVSADPYAGVNWAATRWFKAQLHDHAGTDTARIRAYDRAGYDAFTLMTYSGVDSLSYAWRERRWPVEAWLSPAFRASLGHIAVWFPDGEEVGYDHMTSAFAVTFFRKSTSPADLGYRTTQELIDQIGASGGLAILAHPWTSVRRIQNWTGLFGLEIYNAFAEYRRVVAKDSAFVSVDRNAELVANWDSLLTTTPTLRAIAVNDHYGPDNKDAALPSSIRDSGKVLIVAEAVTLEALKAAVARGTFFAVRDLGAEKDRFPRIDSLAVGAGSISLFGATGAVRWIGNGQVVGTGAVLALGELPSGLRYVRAEVADGPSVLYTQAFALAAGR